MATGMACHWSDLLFEGSWWTRRKFPKTRIIGNNHGLLSSTRCNFYQLLFLKTVSLAPHRHVCVCRVRPPSWMPGFRAELGGFLGSFRIYQQDPTHRRENGHLQDPAPRGKLTYHFKHRITVCENLPVMLLRRYCWIIGACVYFALGNDITTLVTITLIEVK